MQITRLKLLGFKSFVEPSELIIRSGLTGIVGPNGCGKSNLLEALRWVMGETSYKAMRGGAMDDVIFSGTQNRPARNHAEVTVEVDNRARTAPSEFNDAETLEIVRLIERGQGSSYRVNGRETRAKDVKLLFEDAATGARSHALVRQGQIGEIVNAKPQARRRILEDAAGIAGLHSRRHEAELRLSAAEDNLERIGDVIGQLDAQLTSLKRQQRQAEQYRIYSRALREQTALGFYLEWLAAGLAVKQAESDLEVVFDKVARLTGAETEALNERERLQGALAPLRHEEARSAAALERLAAERDHIAKEEKQILARQQALSTQGGEARADLGRDEQLIEEARQVSARLDLERVNSLEELKRLTTEAAALKEKCAHSQNQLAGEEAEFTALQTKVSDVRAQSRSLQDEESRLQAQMVRLQDSFAQLQKEQSAFSQQARLLPETLSPAEIEALEGNIHALGAQLADLETKARAQSDKLTTAREAFNHAALQLTALETEIGYIEKLLSAESGGGHDPVLMAITTAPGYEKALWAALGDDLDVPLADDALSDGVVSGSDGNLTAYWNPSAPPHAALPLPQGAVPLQNFVTAPPVISASLAAVGVIEAEDAPRLQPLLKAGQKLVSLSGGLWRWDGFVSLPEGPNAMPRRLMERNRLPSLHSDHDRQKVSHQQSLNEVHTLEAALKTLEAEQKNLELHRARQQETLQAAYHKQRARAEAERQHIEKQTSLHQALDHKRQELAQAQTRHGEIHSEKAELEDISALTQQLESALAKLQKAREETAALKLAYANVLSEEKLHQKRLDELEAEKQRWASRAEEAAGHITALKTRLEKIEDELRTLQTAPEEIAAKRAHLFEQMSGAEQIRAAAGDKLALAETTAQQHEQALRQVQEDLMAARESKARVETQLEGARAKLITLAEAMRTSLNITPDQALAVAGIGDDQDLPRLADVEAEIARLKTARERLGAVNLRAEEEMKTLEAQFGDLLSERDDLADAVAQLRRAINQLNEEGRERLLHAFDEVNGHFQKLFQTLFAGGEASLQLVDSDDPLEAGLEIIARPPGKKPQVLTLLSGGEKALTAMSLIFAVFLTNPSPICVLDEVDAPLDDSNVERFCGMLEEMANQTETRFLVITHHPMTMERMDRLFGVTMSERGVSQLVSVDLATAEALRESA